MSNILLVAAVCEGCLRAIGLVSDRFVWPSYMYTGENNRFEHGSHTSITSLSGIFMTATLSRADALAWLWHEDHQSVYRFSLGQGPLEVCAVVVRSHGTL